MNKKLASLGAAAALFIAASGCRTGSADINSQANLLSNGPKKGRDLKIIDSKSVDLAEVSGITIRPNPKVNGGWEAVMIGDAAYAVFVQPLTQSGKPDGKGERLSLKDLFNSGGASQWEDIVCDNQGRFIVLAESPPRIEIISRDGREIEHSIKLKFDELGYDRNRDLNSLGEGLILLKSGNVIIAKEKNPPGLVEFGPEGKSPKGISDESVAPVNGKWPFDREVKKYVPLKMWEFDRDSAGILKDLSSITISEDGKIYVLSDESKRIARIESTLSPEENSIAIREYWDLPNKIKKPEGFAFFGTRIIVTSDQPKGDDNFFILAPLESR